MLHFVITSPAFRLKNKRARKAKIRPNNIDGICIYPYVYIYAGLLYNHKYHISVKVVGVIETCLNQHTHTKIR